MLSAAQMARMSELLEQAVDLDRAGRQRWLQALPEADRDLEVALRQALLPQDGARGPLDAPPGLDGDDRAQFVDGPQPGQLVGPYLLERLLGAGGMAQVWLAQRADGALRREVALKLPMLGGLRQDLASRFARERDILAQLEHPHIARLYDAGVSAEGLPYLAMEYVPGRPLTAWCDEQRVGLRERLRLYLQVLDAVQYAHDRHVLHRDIKPSNILVTAAGQVRLLDFGVAKLLAAQPENTELTRVYGRALTPEYASPELLRGDEVKPPSDIYALGVVLYELLAGSRPYRLQPGASCTALEQAVLQAQVQRPSTQLGAEAAQARASTPAKLARRLRGDLDAIVLKALQLDPNERYPSAEALAEDLQRYLRGEPVEAHAPHTMYRASKFVLRHRAGAGATALFALLAVALVLQYRALHRSQTADGPAVPTAPAQPTPVATVDKSIAVLPFLDMSEKRDQEYFSDGLTEELIDRLSRSPDLRVIARTSSFSFKGKQLMIGEIARALHVSHLLEGSVRKSGTTLRISAQLIRASDASHLWSHSYERRMADVFKVQDEIAGTVARALDVVLLGSGQGDRGGEPDSEAHNLLLQANFLSHRLSKADNERAIAIYQKALSRDPNYALAWAMLARARMDQANNGWTTIVEGITQSRNAAERALRADPELAYAHKLLGWIHRDFDWDWEAARTELERARELNPNDLYVLADLAFLNGGMSGQLNPQIDYLRQVLSRDPLDSDAQQNLSWLLYAGGRLEESVASWRKLLELNPTYAGAQASLGRTLLLMNRLPEAIAEVEKESDEAWRLSVLPAVAWALGRRGESDAALKQLEQKYAGEFPCQIAQMYAYRGETDAAFDWLERAYRQHDAAIITMRIEPLFRGLNNDPRYRILLDRMKITDRPM
jgi:serine/threonine protein kinase/TolB-like protein/Flp pilus assembly protein TadD